MIPGGRVTGKALRGMLRHGMDNYDVVIIGTGPAGLGAAFELLTRRPDLSVLVLDKNEYSSGGLRNDCKMNFSWPIGFPDCWWTQEVVAA